MSASYFDLLKYAATGQASPDMTYYDRMRASTLMGGVVQTLTGQPPLSFKSDGTPLISWSMKGNGQQTGTPTPDNPVMPEFVGVRTGNLFSADNTSATVGAVTVKNENGHITIAGKTTAEIYGSNVAWKNAFSFILKAGTYFLTGANSGGVSTTIRAYSDNTSLAGNNQSFTLVEDTRVFLGFYIYNNTNNNFNIMLNLGSTALPFEPFGYKIPISCGGETTPMYLGQVSTVRRIRKLVLTGQESGTWTPNPSIRNGSAFYNLSVFTGYKSNSGAGYCTHYPLATATTDTIGVFFGGNINFITAFSEGIDTADKWKAYLADQYAAGHPVTVWYVLSNEQTTTVNEPLCKIGTYADELHSTDAGVTIPTTKGQNTLTIETDLQPSEMTITYKG